MVAAPTSYKNLTRQGVSVPFTPATTALSAAPLTAAVEKQFPWLYGQSGGKFYRRRDDDGTVKGAWFLVGDGQTDNYPALQAFATHLESAQEFVTLRVPPGSYFCSQPIKWRGTRIHLDCVFGAEFVVPAGVRAHEFHRFRHEEIFVATNLHTRALGKDPNDGLIRSDTPGYAEYLSYVSLFPGDTDLFGTPVQFPDANDPAKLIRSVNPEHYHANGIWTNAILHLFNPRAQFFTGAGIRFSAHNIWDHTPDTPIGTNSSLSKVIGGLVRECGAGVCVDGDDANMVKIEDFDGRNNALQGIYQNDMEGGFIANNHCSTNGLGGYWLIGPSNRSTVLGDYVEGDATANRFLGRVEIHGGLLRNAAFWGPFANRQQGSEFNKIVVEELHATGGLSQGTDNYHMVRSEPVPNPRNTGHVRVSIGGEVAGSSETFGAGVHLANGRTTQRAGTASALHYNGGLLELTVEQFPLTDWQATFLFRAGDMLRNQFPTAATPAGWRCVAGGLAPGYSYAQMENLTVRYAPEVPLTGHLLELSGPSHVIAPYDTLVLNGQRTAVISLQDGPNGPGTIVTVNVAVGLADGPNAIAYPVATFAATGHGAGTSAERPKLQAGGDLGWLYFNTDSGKPEHWNGRAFV